MVNLFRTLARIALTVALALPLGMLAGPSGVVANAATEVAPVQLIMVTRKGCHYCEAWEKEIGVGYPKTAEAAAAPLLRVDIDGPWPDNLALDRQPYLTPSFILIHDRQEVGRMEGYVGDMFFYPLLRQMLTDNGITVPPAPAGDG